MQAEIHEHILRILDITLKPVLGQYDLDFQKEGDQWRINLTSPAQNLLLENNEELLKSVQHILRVLTHRKFPQDRTHFIIDIDNHRLEREKVIKKKTRQIAETEVLQTGATLILINLSSYERKLIHSILTDISGLETTSVGQGLNRKLIIRPTSDTGSIGMDNAQVIDLFN